MYHYAQINDDGVVESIISCKTTQSNNKKIKRDEPDVEELGGQYDEQTKEITKKVVAE